MRGRIPPRRPLALGLFLCLGLLIPSTAAALEHPFLGTFGGANEPSFTDAQGMAVDPDTGDLLVIDAGNREPEEGTLSRWNPDGTPSDFSALGTNVIEDLSFRFPEGGQVAVDNSGGPTDGNIYVTNRVSPAEVRIFDKDGNSLGQLTEFKQGPAAEGPSTPFGGFICGVAVDPDGNVYLSEFSGGGLIHKYEPTGNAPINGDNVANFTFADPCTVAAGTGSSDGFIFPVHLNSEGESVAKLDSTTGAQKYVVDPGPITTVTVDPVSGFLFAASGSEVKEYDVSGETEAIPGLPIAPGGERVAGIAVDGDSGRIYVSREGNSNIEVWGAAVQLPIAITESASVIEGTVTMHGVVNANEGAPATCVFQYVEVSAEGFNGATSVPCSPAGPFTGNTPVAVSAEVSGLAEAFYRFRLLASNEDGSKAGEALTFDTFEKVPGLPDGRAYEMVSPPQKAGEVIPPEPTTQLGGSCGDCLPGENLPTMPMQSTPEGNSVLYLGQPFFGGLFSGANEYIAPRTSSGWGIQSLNTPTMTGRFVAFSEDLSRGVLAQANPALSPQAPVRGGNGFANLYLREDGSLEPLITSEPPNRNPGDFEVLFSGANAGTALIPPFGHVVFEADDALTGEVPGIAPAAPEVEAGECTLGAAECNLYEWEGGELRLVNVLPNGDAASGAVIGAGRLLLTASDARFEAAAVDGAISEDGSRIFWSSEETGEVYVRVDGEETLEIPGPGSCEKSVVPKERACFLTASPDGSTVLLADGQIYELNEAGSAYLATVDLSDGEGGFEGILGAAEDLSRVYFIDTAALTDESEENENKEHAEASELNLYAWEGGELAFIGMLLPGDNAFGVSFRYGAWKATAANRTAQVSLDGGYLAFMSTARLSGYDNRLAGGGDCRSGEGAACREVFVYAAEEESLACASCNPSGERPLGYSNLSLLRPDAPFRQPGNLSGDGSGRLFFESQDALVAGDANGNIQDVYEWEPEGVGSCGREAGCVYLISGGQSPNDSMFVDSSASGDDAFFITRERLLPRDKDQQLDLYDARVGGGFEEFTEGPCGPEACAGPLGGAPAQPPFGSEELIGPGNAQRSGAPKSRCPKGKRRARRNGKARCVAKRKANQQRKHGRRANADGRASR
jgi:hypothetical protein